MRTYYRASGGLDAAVQGLIFWAVLLTSTSWIVGIGGLVAYEHFIDEPKRARVNAAQMEASKPAREAARLAELQAKKDAAIRWDDAQRAPWPSIKCDAARASLSTNTRMARHGYGQTWADRALTDQATLAAHCKGNP